MTTTNPKFNAGDAVLCNLYPLKTFIVHNLRFNKDFEAWVYTLTANQDKDIYENIVEHSLSPRVIKRIS